MVLLIRVVPPAKHDRGAGKTYNVATPSHLTVFYSTATESPPSDLTIRSVLDDKSGVTLSRVYFATPCTAVLLDENTGGAARRSSTLRGPNRPLAVQQMLEHISGAVSARQNVTFINRGDRCDEYFTILVRDVLGTIREAAETAMQYLAEETAKEKQMQRLLQAEGERDAAENGTGNGAAADGAGAGNVSAAAAGTTTGTAAPGTGDPEEAFGLSSQGQFHNPAGNLGNTTFTLSGAFCANMRQLRQRYPQLLSSAPPSGNRFAVLTGTFVGELVPPAGPVVSLLPQSFIENPLIATETTPPTSALQAPAKGSISPRRSRFSTRGAQYSGQQKTSFAALPDRQLVASFSKEMEDGVSGEETEESDFWGGNSTCLELNGETSTLAVPGIVNFEELIASFSVDFWLCTDCEPIEGRRILLEVSDAQQRNSSSGQLLQIALNWYSDQPAAVRLYVRDNENRTLECILPFEDPVLTSGVTFHHVMLNVDSLEEGKVSGFVDGKSLTVRYLQQERPMSFSTWPHQLFIGCHLNDSGDACDVLRGSICEVRFWAGAQPRIPVLRWPLLVEKDVNARALEPNADARRRSSTSSVFSNQSLALPATSTTFALSEEVGAAFSDRRLTIENVATAQQSLPTVCPRFDGTLAVNLGAIPMLGSLMLSWGVEVCFRTDCTTRIMTLIGVTDEQGHKPGFGIVLNAEPLTSKEKFQFREFNVTLYLTDTAGYTCSALLRGSDRRNVMDGQWHTLSWRCIDSESNNFEVKVDGATQDLLHVVRDGPSRFAPLNNWVCLGGHNERNWKIQRPFYGDINRCCILAGGTPLVNLQMCEGPGASVLRDVSGRCNHGLLIDVTSKKRRCHNVVWAPVTVTDGIADDAGGASGADIVIHKNNVVAVAAVAFTCDFTSSGTSHEIILDLLHGAAVHPDSSSAMDFTSGPLSPGKQSRIQSRSSAFQNAGERKVSTLSTATEACGEPRSLAALNSWGTWRCLPQSCFQPVETGTDLEEVIEEALSAAVGTEGHVMLVIRIGDCNVTLVNVHGPVLPTDAQYDPNMLTWHYRFAVEGIAGRRAHMLNEMVKTMESVLVGNSLMPYMTSRLGPVNSKRAMPTEKLIRQSERCGRPWYFAAVLQNQLCNASTGSSLHIVHNCESRVSAGTAASIALFNRELYRETEERACLIIQRNWRIHMARNVATGLESQRIVQEQKLEELQSLRMNPIVKPKRDLVAVVITLHDVRAPLVPALTYDMEEMLSLFRRLGYEVVHLTNPSRQAFLNTLASINPDCCSFVYISGYGGAMRVRPPPPIGLQRLSLSLAESTKRSEEQQRERSAWRSIMSAHQRELEEIQTKFPKVSKKGKKGDAASAGKSAKLNAADEEQQRRQMEEAIRTEALNVERDEAEARQEVIEKEYDLETRTIFREMKQAIATRKAFEARFVLPKKQGAATQAEQLIFPCESATIDPYSHLAIPVQDVLESALHLNLPPLGLQCIVAVDLEPVLPTECGFSCLASSTGYRLSFNYAPGQRRILTHVLTKALDGHFPQVVPSSRHDFLRGSIETSEDQRDWKSLATYVTQKMQSSIPVVGPAAEALQRELGKEVPYTADLIPIRAVLTTKDARARQRRDLASSKAEALMTLAVDSSSIFTDPSTEFKNVIKELPITEASFSNAVLFTFGQKHNSIDGILLSALEDELSAALPSGNRVNRTVSLSCRGARVDFEVPALADRTQLGQWITTLMRRSLSWKLPVNPFFGSQQIEVTSVELLYSVRCNGPLPQCQHLRRQCNEKPTLSSTVRFLSCTVT